ncbi:hypothetical protein EDB82DRAFT_504025 [Fusarium venenatum]|uniref:uncharacterized protein n=1 Tax=Fusarium venenatum TaxID=56646 RepID=UPI001DDBF19C|nr:hypothetical protein EDB82DRAFT_504025 [Fusarium venenatum]
MKYHYACFYILRNYPGIVALFFLSICFSSSRLLGLTLNVACPNTQVKPYIHPCIHTPRPLKSHFSSSSSN